MAAVPTIIPDLQRRATTQLFKDAGTPLKNLFPIVKVKSVSSLDPVRVDERCHIIHLLYHSSLPVSILPILSQRCFLWSILRQF